MINDLLLITNLANSLSCKDYFTDSSILDFDQCLKLDTPPEWITQPREFLLNFTQREIEQRIKITQPKGIVIDLFLESSKSTASNLAIDLTVFLRLCDVKLPIIIVSKGFLATEKDGLIIDPKSYQTLIDLKVGKFLTYNHAFNKIISIDSEVYPIYEYLHQDNFNLTEFLAEFSIVPSDDRHQMTNEWGAIKLAFNAGYTLEDIGYDFPQNTYFKYLQKKFSLDFLTFTEREELLKEYSLPTTQNKINLSTFLKNKKILLIDDNAEKGWTSVLEKIFDARIVSKSSIKDFINIDRQEYISFDLVFLDLYMPNSHGNLKEKENSIKLLEALKIGFPQIPIIVFTASNKSWTLDEVLEKGADGMYVKESPEFAGNATYSKENFKNFFSTVVNCLKRYKTLRPYWSKIEFIFQNFLPEVLDIGTTQFESRITERLKMFFGLLKRGLEEKGFNSREFYFSDNELVFITIWSILNEISEAFYEKIHPNDIEKYIDKKGKEYFLTPIPGYNWKIKGQDDFLIKYKFELDYDEKNNIVLTRRGLPSLKKKSCVSNLILIHEEPYFELKSSNREEVKRELFLQIAFLILKCNKYSIPMLYKEDMTTNLYDLNKKRNKLYLTHGDYIYKGFFEKTEQEKRKDRAYEITPYGDIKKLFELVGLLLTGQETIVDI
ncbi:MAG TPA: response regulator [Haliscomenobacter sp.]|uniref:response regulator n=1 Tax=Haliscomenobacter sp. TaxID=2717303 RepID=UPI002B9E8D18|nr:response regulator [Haliscomenobacter sp.]HOY17983.1 response regulator [Haliscomenobacter sp.]